MVEVNNGFGSYDVYFMDTLHKMIRYICWNFILLCGK